MSRYAGEIRSDALTKLRIYRYLSIETMLMDVWLHKSHQKVMSLKRAIQLLLLGYAEKLFFEAGYCLTD